MIIISLVVMVIVSIFKLVCAAHLLNASSIRASFDEGMTLPEENWILLDEEKGAYSSITSVDDQTIGIIYEGSQSDITFQKIAVSEFMKQ